MCLCVHVLFTEREELEADSNIQQFGVGLLQCSVEGYDL